MVQQNLVAYIMSQLRQGKKLEDVNRFLLEAGYDKSAVEGSVQYVINLQTNPEIAEEQRIQQLSDYINKQMQAGYGQQAIANFLISRGYPYYEVNVALQQATLPKKEVKVEHKLAVFAVIVILVMALAVTAMYFKLYTLFGQAFPEQLLDVETEKLTTIVQQGGELSFQVKLLSFGYNKRFDVELEYKIVDRDTQAVVLEKGETLALSTTLENIVTFDIPDTMKTGKYVLRVDATYQEFTATSGFIFDVLSADIAEETLKEIREQIPVEEELTDIPELEENVTEPVEPVGPQVVPEPIPPAPRPGVPKFFEGMTKKQAFEMVKAASVREPNKAVAMCNEFELPGNLQGCFMTLASFKKDANFCRDIEEERARDSCYMQAILETKQFDLCDKITNQHVKQSCEVVSATEEAQKAADAGNMEDAQFILQTIPLTGG
ncbi:hypothetical protein ACFL3V_01965 [Nanoarchaeota archaeon]